jgi:hypothetical protein
MVNKAAHTDWDDTIDAFWKARNATGYNAIQKYVLKGLLADKNGRQYILIPSKERENGQMESIRTWWETLYERKSPTMSIKDIFGAIATGDLK